MFELQQEILMSAGSVSHLASNLSIFFHEVKDLMLSCVVHENQVCHSFWTFHRYYIFGRMKCKDNWKFRKCP